MSEELTPMTPPSEQSGARTSEVQPLCFTDKLVGVFSEPGAAFENVHLTEKKASDWVIPTIILIVIAIAAQFIKFSNPDIMADIQNQQNKAIQERVQSGQMTQEQADQAMGAGGGMMRTMMYVGTAVGVPIVTFILLFVMALVWWLVSKFALKSTPMYMKVVSVLGLASLISSLQAIVGTITAILQGKMISGPNLGLLVSDLSMGNVVHRLLMSIDPFTIWYLAVVGIGLAKISSAKVSRSLIWVFGLWVVWTLLYVFVLGNLSIFRSMG
jgi:hypothetical protein